MTNARPRYCSPASADNARSQSSWSAHARLAHRQATRRVRVRPREQRALQHWFNVARFLVTPILCQEGFKLFVDCDMVFERDPREMLREVPSRLPLSVVKHEHEPTRSVKMMEQAQNAYPARTGRA